MCNFTNGTQFSIDCTLNAYVVSMWLLYHVQMCDYANLRKIHSNCWGLYTPMTHYPREMTMIVMMILAEYIVHCWFDFLKCVVSLLHHFTMRFNSTRLDTQLGSYTNKYHSEVYVHNFKSRDDADIQQLFILLLLQSMIKHHSAYKVSSLSIFLFIFLYHSLHLNSLYAFN